MATETKCDWCNKIIDDEHRYGTDIDVNDHNMFANLTFCSPRCIAYYYVAQIKGGRR